MAAGAFAAGTVAPGQHRRSVEARHRFSLEGLLDQAKNHATKNRTKKDGKMYIIFTFAIYRILQNHIIIDYTDL